MNESTVGVRWMNPESKGYTDILPIAWFKKEATTPELRHPVLGPKGGVYFAKCILSVDSTTADLDYEAFPEFNQAEGMYLGIMRIQFPDTSRREIAKVEWRNPGHKAFTAAPVEIIADPLPKVSPYNMSKTNTKKALKEAKARPGQVRFRSRLMLAYDGTCCISGCSVQAVLEGAHIDPFHGPSSDHPQNGLLLRHDLHALFDTGLLAIDPDTRLVYFGPPALAWPDYASLHRTACVAEPTYGGTLYSPSYEALSRRWNRFKKVYK